MRNLAPNHKIKLKMNRKQIDQKDKRQKTKNNQKIKNQNEKNNETTKITTMRQVMNDHTLNIQDPPKAQNHQTNTNLTQTKIKTQTKNQSATNATNHHKTRSPNLVNSNSTVTEMIDFNYVTQLHKQAQKGALTKHEELHTAGTNQRRPSEVFKLKNRIELLKVDDVFFISNTTQPNQIQTPSIFIKVQLNYKWGCK
ncbi:Hypothetical_protein [Hexamita inflata]|uniref:Hypothetical_protein n=1 Tax=Hexamita inflata TaxID=28002 RepID=A0AA86NXK0_9EUKA|nr:Hypothetical protein HINF_LOCUS14570 [Hexamita inflata]